MTLGHRLMVAQDVDGHLAVYLGDDHQQEPLHLLSCPIQTANAPVAAPTMVETNAVCCVVASEPRLINQSQTFHAISVNSNIIRRGSSFHWRMRSKVRSAIHPFTADHHRSHILGALANLRRPPAIEHLRRGLSHVPRLNRRLSLLEAVPAWLA